MAVEIEAKMAVPELGPVRDRLRQRGAEPIGRFCEVNSFFDTQGHALLVDGKGLRLRLNRNVDTGAQTNVITYKGPLQQGSLKAREEVELTVDNTGDAVELLKRLGFHLTLSFEKRRESWRLGACRVELDEVPHLGQFVEIEGPDEATVLRERESLGLSNRSIVKASYIGLLMDHLREAGQSTASITFADALPG